MVAPRRAPLPEGGKALTDVPRPACALILGPAFLLAACVPQGLAFVQDDRLEIIAPESHSTVTVPLTIRWTFEDEARGAGGSGTEVASFAVFLDRAPVPPGESLSWVAREDQRCLRTTGCPDETYLADRGIYETTDTAFTIEQVRDLDAFRGHETHEAAIVLLDATGRRIGESAWHTTFFFDRDGI